MINLLQKAFYEVLVRRLHRYRRNANHARGLGVRSWIITHSDRGDVGNRQRKRPAGATQGGVNASITKFLDYFSYALLVSSMLPQH